MTKVAASKERVNKYICITFGMSILKLEDLKVLKRSPDLLNNVKIGQGQLWLIIQSYFVLPYMGSGHFDQVT